MTRGETVHPFASAFGTAGKLSFAALLASAAFIGAGIRAYAAWIHDRGELARLGQLTDVELRDLGLGRGDLYAVRTDWNPTASLTRLVGERGEFVRI